MPGGQVDREEWARVVRELLDEHTRGKKEPFARLVGVNARTVHAWLDCAVKVSETNVVKIAEATGRNPVDLLVRVGYLAEQHVPRFPGEVIDEEQRRVLERDDLDDEQKAYILAELESWRETDEELLAAQRERDRRTRDARVDNLIEHIRRGA